MDDFKFEQIPLLRLNQMCISQIQAVNDVQKAAASYFWWSTSVINSQTLHIASQTEVVKPSE